MNEKPENLEKTASSVLSVLILIYGLLYTSVCLLYNLLSRTLNDPEFMMLESWKIISFCFALKSFRSLMQNTCKLLFFFYFKIYLRCF